MDKKCTKSCESQVGGSSSPTLLKELAESYQVAKEQQRLERERQERAMLNLEVDRIVEACKAAVTRADDVCRHALTSEFSNLEIQEALLGNVRQLGLTARIERPGSDRPVIVLSGWAPSKVKAGEREVGALFDYSGVSNVLLPHCRQGREDDEDDDPRHKLPHQ